MSPAGPIEAALHCPPPPGWEALREVASSRLEGIELPTTRMEDWKYLDLRPVRDLPLSPCAPVPVDIRERILPEARGARLAFGNGHLDERHSCLSGLPKGCQFRRLEPGDELLPPPAEADAFELLNAARFASGARIHLARGQRVEMPLHVLFAQLSSGDPAASFPRLQVRLEAQSELTLVEEYHGEGRYLCCPVVDVELGEGALLRHERVQQESPESFHFATLRARVASGARYELRTVTLGGRISRQSPRITLPGQGSELHMDGLVLLDGEQVADSHTVIDHQAGNTTSRQAHKCIVDGRSRAIFNGRIYVRPGAQATNAQQQSRNLLLSEFARVDTKPQLEIFADDVKCAHGAAVGQLDAEEVFYLRSRGLGTDTARNLLTWAFASEILERISVSSLRKGLRHAVMARTHAGSLEGDL